MARARRPRRAARGGRSRAPSAASCASRPAARSRDPRGARWSVEGALAVLDARVAGRRAVDAPTTPTRSRACGRRSPARPPARCCSRRRPATSSSTGARQAHVGGGSHGSLHAERLARRAGHLRRRAARRRARRSGRSATSPPLVLRHFGLPAAAARASPASRSRGRREPPGRPVHSADATPVVALACVALLARAPLPARSATPRVAPGRRARTLAARTDSAYAAAGGLRRRRSSQRPGATTARRPTPTRRSRSPPRTRRRPAGGCRPTRCWRSRRALPKMRAVRARIPRLLRRRLPEGAAPLAGELLLQATARRRSARSIIDDLSGRVLEQWTGFQVAWTMARGYRARSAGTSTRCTSGCRCACCSCCRSSTSAGRCRCCTSTCSCCCRFSVSLAFFNHAHIYASVPLVYPPLLYLLARMLALLRRRGRAGDAPAQPRPLRLLVPGAVARASAVVFLIGFRVGAERHRLERDRRRLRGRDRRRSGSSTASRCTAAGRRDNEHGDTYGPVNYEAYVPFEQIVRLERHAGTTCRPPTPPRSSSTCSRSALLFLLGRRVRGPDARDRARLRVGLLPVHAVRAGEQHQRHARGRARARRAARRSYVDARRRRARRVRRARRPDQVRAARARAAARHPRRCGELPRAAPARCVARSRSSLGFVAAPRRCRVDPGAHPRLAAHDLRAHARLPGRSRLALLGLGAVRRARRLQAAVQVAALALALVARARARAAPTWSAWRPAAPRS